MGVPLKQGRQNSNFLTTYARLLKISKGYNTTTFGDTKLKVSPLNEATKIQTF